MLHSNLMALCFVEPKLQPIKDAFRPFLVLKPWPRPDNLHIRTWPIFPGKLTRIPWIYTGCMIMNFPCQ